MTRVRRIYFVSILIVLGVLAAGCNQPQNGRPAAPPSTTTARPTYAMNVVVSQVPFWAQTKTAWAVLPQHFPVKTVFGGPQNDNAQEQINEIEALLASHINGLVIAPTDSKALVGTIDKAVAQGVPVVTYLVDAPGSKRLTYITSPLEAASKAVADYALQATKRAPSGGVIISYGTAGSEEQERRANGFKEVIKANRGMKLAGLVEDKFDDNTGADQIKAILTRDRTVKYIFGCNSRSAAAAVLALKELGHKPGDVTITGWDHDPDVLGNIQAGWITASAAQQTTFMTNLAFAILHSASNGYMYPRDLNLRASGVLPLPDRIEVPVAIVNAGNAAAYKPAGK